MGGAAATAALFFLPWSVSGEFPGLRACCAHLPLDQRSVSLAGNHSTSSPPNPRPLPPSRGEGAPPPSLRSERRRQHASRARIRPMSDRAEPATKLVIRPAGRDDVPLVLALIRE